MWKTVKIVLEGDAPLLMHRLDPTMLVKNEKTPRKGTPEWIKYNLDEWKRTAYWNDKEKFLYIPGSAIEGCLRDAGKGDKENKRPVVKLVQSAFYCDQLQYPLNIPSFENKNLEDLEDFVVDHAVRIERARIARRRLCIPMGWTCTITAKVDTSQLSETLLEKLIERAGDQIGLLDWRPKYGRFKVKKVVW